MTWILRLGTVADMIRWLAIAALAAICLLVVSVECPAPLTYRAGEGWTYESVGGEKWRRTRAKDQLDVAQAAFDKKSYGLAAKAARRTVKVWPLSDYAPRAQYLLGRAYEARRMDERAFKEYQKLLQKYPKVENYPEVLQRQFEIANRYLAGQWFKLWGYIPFFPSMDRTAQMYDNLIKNGPYSAVAPQAQLNIGTAREKQREYFMAVKAYERAADRYHDQPTVASDALYRAGLAYNKQAKTAEYDQSVAGLAINTFGDFSTLYPTDPRVTDANEIVASLKTEQARGNFQIAKYYNKKRRYDAALIYFNETIIKDPNSTYAQEAKKLIEVVKAKKAARDKAQAAKEKKPAVAK